jgi:hypothetical protein
MPVLPMSLELPRYEGFRLSPLADWTETLVVEAQTTVIDTDQIVARPEQWGEEHGISNAARFRPPET